MLHVSLNSQRESQCQNISSSNLDSQVDWHVQDNVVMVKLSQRVSGVDHTVGNSSIRVGIVEVRDRGLEVGSVHDRVGGINLGVRGRFADLASRESNIASGVEGVVRDQDAGHQTGVHLADNWFRREGEDNV